MPQQPSPHEIAERVRAHPSVARLHGGRFGEIASYLPGEKVVGVRLREDGPAEIGVVLRTDRFLWQTADELRAELVELIGGPVDIVVSDIVDGEEAGQDEQTE